MTVGYVLIVVFFMLQAFFCRLPQSLNLNVLCRKDYKTFLSDLRHERKSVERTNFIVLVHDICSTFFISSHKIISCK